MSLEVLEPYLPWLMWGGGVLSVALVLASLIGLPRVLCGLPEDYLWKPPRSPARGRWLRNGLGVLLILLGVLMLVLPGQGLLTIVAGLILTDVPGKHRWIVKVLSQATILGAVNGIRARSDQPPLRSPP